jgi:hypothetical protein
MPVSAHFARAMVALLFSSGSRMLDSGFSQATPLFADVEPHVID